MTFVIKARGSRVHRTSLFVSSALVLTLTAPGVVQAACAPNPPRASERTLCSGVETAPLVIREAGSDVLVEQDATLSAAAASSILIALPDAPYDWIEPVTIQIDGSVNGGTSSAIAVASYGDIGWLNAIITVSATGRISGPAGIDLVTPSSIYPYPSFRRTAVLIDNGGVIGSSAGSLALHGSDDGQAFFQSILNRSTGTIGAIQGRVGTLTNEGLIDGGVLSAFSKGPGPAPYNGSTSITNSGTMRSNGSADTLRLGQIDAVDNSGDILAEGSGLAISGANIAISNGENGRIVAHQTAISATQSVRVNNRGTISGGGDAITSEGALILINQGTILGNVRSGNIGSFIMNIGGTIDGDILLGSDNDSFFGDVDNVDQPFGTVTGRVDAGDGNDTLIFNFREDRVLDHAIALPDTFEALSLWVGGGATLTFSRSFASTTAVTLASADFSSYRTDNRFVLAGSLDTQGPALIEGNNNSSGFVVSQSGTILAHLTDPDTYAASFRDASLFDNSGTITAIGGGGVAGSSARIINSGTITADATAVRAWSGVVNSGAIRSSQGIGADIFYGMSSNSGVIEGATAGARVVQGTLVNDGTISSAGNGVEIGWHGTLFNRAGGVITGGTAGIASPSANADVQQVYVINAGIINGDVTLGGRPYSYGSGNVFAALSGGIVNGDIHLGSGYDIFATSLVNSGPGEFAGLTGRVSGSGVATLRYLIDADTMTTPALKGIFSNLSYQLANDATLTLTGPSSIDLGFAGSGKVVLAGDFTGDTDAILIDLTDQAIRINGEDQAPANAIAMTNNGTITVREGPGSGASYGTAIIVGDGNSFTNHGTVDVQVGESTFYNFPSVTAIAAGSGAVVNHGTILLSGATGIRGDFGFGAGAIIRNAGVIEQVRGGAWSAGITGAGTVVNSGRIDTEGNAISLRAGSFVTNSGILRSSAAEAVRGNEYYDASKLWNQSGALIAGGPDASAVLLSSGSILANEGTIEGDVVMRYDPYGFRNDYGQSIFISRGGTLNGNLTLTKNDDIVIALNGITGITGSIDTLTGNDMFVRAYDETATVTLDAGATPPAGFEGLGFAAYGADTVVTLSGERAQTTPLFLAGDGTIVNAIAMNETGATGLTSVTLGSAADPTNSLGAGSTLTFVNLATLARGVAGYAHALDNQGVINGYDLYQPVVKILANDAAGFSFRNSGTIANVDAPQDAFGGMDWYAVAIDRLAEIGTSAYNRFDNSGQIVGGVRVTADTRSFSFVNSGRIDAANPYFGAALLTVGPRYNLEYPGSANADDASIANSGTMNGTLSATVSALRVTVANSGSINGYVRVSQPGQIDGYDQQGYPAQTSQDSFSFVNSGSMYGATLDSAAIAMDIANSGTITRNTVSHVGTALAITAQSAADRAIRIMNEGAIVGKGIMTSALTLDAYGWAAEESGRVPPDSVISLTNRGIISADSGAGYSAAINDANPALLTGVTAVGIMAPGDGASDVTIVNAAGATISANGATSYAWRYWEPDDAPRIVPETYATTGSLAVGVLADRVSLDNAGTIRGLAGGMIGADTEVALGDNALDLSGRFLAGAVQTFHSADTVVNRSTGVIIGSIDLGEMDDKLINAGTIDGGIFLGSGNDSMTHAIGGTLTGIVDGGEGTDKVVIDITGGGLLGNALIARFVNFESKIVSGSGTVTTDGPFLDDTLFLRDTALELGAGQTLQTAGPVAVTFAGGSNLLVNNGTIVGGLDLANGQNQVVNAGVITGGIRFGQDSHMTSLANSVISGTIDVSQGAVFGSAGTVNGAINVGGTLAPGASLGTMTVNGNVTLHAGSNALFQFTPTASDALVINGSLTIAEGATLTLTGNRPLTPGVYTIVSASDGINGSFGTNVMRGDAIEGVLTFGAKAIRLTGLFQLKNGATAQVEQTKDYLNTLLLGGKATPAIVTAFPGMVDADGYASPAILSTLSPEAYASAAQIGIENGLAISGALRSVRMGGLRDEGGLFAFGQAYGNWRVFDADRRGVGQADVDSSGYLGGVGYGNSTVGAALFVGRSEGKQRLGSIGARNDADGMFFGGRVHYASGGLSAGATILFDRSEIDTVRNPAAGGTARSHYDMHGMTIDGWIRYGFEIQSGWRLGPQLGLTHVSISRDALRETGGGAFALDISKQKYGATFLSADLKLEAPGEESLRPWTAIGFRYTLDSDAISATGTLLGTDTAYAVAGAERKKTLPHAGGGVDMAISTSVSLFINGDVEFSGRNGQHHVNGGITFRF
ncbi:hypothetical protein Q4610_05990 [Sphingobium sp. HBC34]|uniref:Autotransporter domain-containing protein n=1 Tax=Sphingobium cyanobacteriorum TaxID=3063954 RepID=A0ABT8ZKE6_9SPHN|nr:hypothetical protein [Sphingobium sp. HBC34]MDO7834593.1 hypothetical protein [Sphingobium sp. HBC34]